MDHPHLTALILAAGKGTRMKSDLAKVLHYVFFAPMIHHVLEVIRSLPFDEVIVVTGYQSDSVEKSLEKYGVRFARQEQPLGTAHAVLSAESLLKKANGTVLIMCGDTPLIRSETVKEMMVYHCTSSSRLTVLSTLLDDPTGYGRIIFDEHGNVARIVEEKDASPAQRNIKEINAGIYCADTGFLLESLARVGTDNKQREFYLTDIVEIANTYGQAVNRFVCRDPSEVMGVNSRVELAQANAMLQARFNNTLMLSGVTLIQPETTLIEKSVCIERDTIIHPNVQISGDSFIGRGCCIESGVIMRNCRLGAGVTLGAYSYLVGCQLTDGEKMAPHSVRAES